jgi:hypothetical protein
MVTTTTESNGRLCNQIIRNLAVSLIAEKNDLFVNYSNFDLITQLGIHLFVGKQSYNNQQVLNDGNYFAVYNSHNIDYDLEPNSTYFQSRDIIQLIYNHLHSEPVKNTIIEKNPYKQRYEANNDLFIHVRLSDVAQHNPGANYYINAIKRIDYENIYLSTDSPENPIITEIKEAFPNINILEYDEVNTIQFGSTCKNIILSHGTFSAVIGYLSFFSDVYYPEDIPGKIWYGELFGIDGWTKCSV